MTRFRSDNPIIKKRFNQLNNPHDHRCAPIKVEFRQKSEQKFICDRMDELKHLKRLLSMRVMRGGKKLKIF